VYSIPNNRSALMTEKPFGDPAHNVPKPEKEQEVTKIQ
jgi:hypothetical protein